MKKALYVATVDIHIKSFHLPYLKLLHDNGYEVHVATNGDEKFPFCDVKHQICIERSPFKLSNIKAIKQLKKIIETEKFDIVHCHTPMGAVVTRLAAKEARSKNGTRVIYTAHGFHFYNGAPILNWFIFYPIEKYLAKYTDTLITINEEDFELAKNKFSRRCKDIQYIPGVGIDVKKFNIDISENEKKQLKKSLGIKQNDFILTCVARLDKNKNQKFLINVMEKIYKKSTDISLLLVGNDEMKGYYQKIVNNKKLNSKIYFLGRREDIPKILSITDVVVSASKREGLPVNIIEAFASNKKVVALNCRGMSDLIINNDNGYICNNEMEFINSIYNIKNNKLESNNSTKDILRKVSIENVVSLMKKVYKIKEQEYE